MNKLLPVIACLLCTYNLSAQMWNGQDTLYGNEWIDYSQSYFRIPVSEDGIYHITPTVLSQAGVPTSVNASDFQLFHMGQEVPLHTSTDGPLQSNDRLAFYGKKNTDELDRFLFKEPDADLLNPHYSMFTDTAAYYLTWSTSATTLRFSESDNNLTNLPAKEAWFWYEQRQIYSNSAIHKTNFDGVSESIFDTGEGFATSYSSDRTLNITPQNVADANVDSEFRIRMVSSHGISHQLQLFINGSLEQEEEWSGVQLKDYTIDRPTNQLNGQQSVRVQGLAPNNDRYAIAHITLKHPRTFDFGGAASFGFELAASNVDRYLEIENFNANGTVVLYDITNQNRYLGIIDDDVVKFKLPPSFEAQQLVLVNESQGVRVVEVLSEVEFVDYTALEASYVFISNPKLYNDAQGDNWVQAYADYRASNTGGNFSTQIIDINQLYEQFAYGVYRHSLSIRNFVHFIARNWETPPEYLLLVGKGREYYNTRNANQLANSDNASFYVPTYGRPGADNLLLGANGSSVPLFPIGRIAAETPQDIAVYLDKVQDYEATYTAAKSDERLWRKQIIHLGGGNSPFEQNTIRNSLEQMANVAATNSVGADIFAFYKTNSDPIQQSQSSLITSRINEGVGIITFFGHSGTGGFDFSIDDPSTYQNEDRYPVMFSLGCLSGQIHSSIRSVGENFIFQENKGAIAFFASVGLGYISSLNSMARNYYDHLGTDLYGESIGKVMQATLKTLDGSFGTASRSLHQQFSLHGDPALRLHPVDGPDYEPLGQSVRFLPEVLNAQMDSFMIAFDVQNTGKAIEDSIEVEVEREFPNGSKAVILRQKLPAPLFSRTYQLKLPISGGIGSPVGFNRFFVRLDPNNEIAEMPLPSARQNNDLVNNLGERGASIYIFANGIQAIYPEPFSIVGSKNLVLKASTANLFAPSQNYIFELDTTAIFDSPIKRNLKIDQSGGLVEWPLESEWLTDSTTYYWRVSQDSTDQFGFIWSESSFLYLRESTTGWNQSHYYQFLDNGFTNIELPEATRQMKYLDDVKTIDVINGVYPEVGPSININNDSYFYLPWDNPIQGGIGVCVVDPISGDPWLNQPPGNFGSHLASPWATNWATYSYRTRTAEWRQRAINFLKDTIPSGHYVIIYTIQTANDDYRPQEWANDSISFGSNLFNLLEQQGATQIRTTATTGAKPYVLFYQKDNPSFPVTEILVEPGELIEIPLSIAGLWDRGKLSSRNIGPAKKWDSFHWDVFSIDSSDEFKFQVRGIRSDSTSTILFEDVTTSPVDLSTIDANIYPYLQLEYQSEDMVNRSVPQLSSWRVFYEGLPEAMLVPNIYYSFHADTIQEGDILRLELGIANVSTADMDSLLISYTIKNELNIIHAQDERYSMLAANDTLTADFNMDTKGLQGAYNLNIELNPNKDQPEQFSFNNFALQPFFVIKDKNNPVLDVTFDGSHIMNGDIVSPSPDIAIRLRDENPFLPLSDTSTFRVFLKYPGAADAVAVPFANGDLLFAPATGNLNQAQLEFTPELTESGTYTLLIQGQDATGNPSGSFDYKIEFEVILEKQISNVLNYPNPFSTSTQFVYTLTGETPPTDFTIQVMTISGRIVRELTQADLGQLKIGTHRTDFSWDGTDQFGDKLANGVYLYRVMIQDENGNDYKKYDTGTDRFFKNDIGKLVILR